MVLLVLPYLKLKYPRILENPYSQFDDSLVNYVNKFLMTIFLFLSKEKKLSKIQV